MRVLLCIFLIAAMLLPLCCAGAEVEMLAASVGKGDALLIRTGGYLCLIDTGKADAQPQLEAALAHWNVKRLDAVFITHTDKDHVGGLKWLRKSGIEIGAVYASAYHPETSKKRHQAVKTADKLGIELHWLKAGDSVPLGDTGAIFRVLAPEVEFHGNEDDNSLVMMLEAPDGRMLLTGDMERKEELLLLQSGADLSCSVLKVPNHGDSDASSKDLIHACGAQIAVISTDSREKEDTPDPTVLKNLKKAGYEIFVTQECSLGVLVRLEGGKASAEYLN